MRQILIKQGNIVVEEVPAPQIEPETVLVQVNHSCVSVGTELENIKASELPLWKRIIKQPDKVKTALNMMMTQGINYTRSLIQSKLDVGQPTGYSAAGVVLEVGEGIDTLHPGDRVACVGTQYAHHAEIIRVPGNLTVPIPEGVNFACASTVALGAIALQGVRRAQPSLGETFVVIGLGILGQLTAQILKANGCQVIGTDLDQARLKLAQDLGLDFGIAQDNDHEIEQVFRLTDGIGADGVIITAATASDVVVSTAFKMCRKKGRVVLVGNVGLNLNRRDFYYKELDFFISTSYGPGRYDNNYEERNLDYPVAYVRWTENRNMAGYLRLMADGKVKVEPLIANIYPIDKADSAYEALKKGRVFPPIVLFSYRVNTVVGAVKDVVVNPSAKSTVPNRIRIAIVGAGSFAKFMHLPNLRSLSDYYHIQAIVSHTGYNALGTAKQFDVDYATTNYEQVLKDPEVDALLIATRHNLHAAMTLQALKADKHVLVEKPLALTREELGEIVNFYASDNLPQNSAPVLMTGFNRRFSPYARRLYELTQNRSNPMILNYRMNAGYLPLDHWSHTEEGGGRNLGEACHIYDLFTYLTGSKVVTVSVQSITPRTRYYSNQDNFIATMKFTDGSVATLTYTALGHNAYSKEQMEVFVDGKVLALDNYMRLTIIGGKAKGFRTRIIEKGHKEELKGFACAIKQGGQWPIPLWQQVQATEIALQVEDLLKGAR